MEDREKLELTPEQSEVLQTYIQNKMIDFLFSLDWQPSNRACFDKPAGVPILHGETLESEEWHKMNVVVTETIENGEASTTVKVNGKTICDK